MSLSCHERGIAPNSSITRRASFAQDWRSALLSVEQLFGLEQCLVPCTALMNSCLKASQWAHTLELFGLLAKRRVACDTVSLNVAVKALAEGRHWERAFAAVAIANKAKLRADAISYSAILSSSNLTWLNALRLLDCMAHSAVQKDQVLQAAVVSWCGKAARWQEAAELLKDAGLETSLLCSNAALQATSLAQQWRSAIEGRRGADRVTFNVALGSLAGPSGWRTAVQMWKDMKKQEVRSDLISHNTVIQVCHSRAWRLSLGIFSALGLERLQPDAVSHGLLLAHQEPWQHAWTLLLKAPVDDLDGAACTAACNACDGWRAVVGLLDHFAQQRMCRSRQGLSSAVQRCGRGRRLCSDATALNVLITALGRADKWQELRGLRGSIPKWSEALQVFLSFRDEADLIACNALMAIFDRVEQWQLAEELFVELNDAQMQPSCSSYLTIISAYTSHCSQWQRALAVLEQFRSGMPLEVSVHNAAMTCCSKSSQWTLALHLFSELRAAGLQADLISASACVSAAAASSKWWYSLSCLAALESKSLSTTVHACSSACSSCKSWEHALMLLQTLRRGANVIAYNAVMGCESSEHAWPQALFLYASLHHQRLTADATSYNTLTSTCSSALLWRSAISFLSESSEVMAYDSALQACLNAGEVDRGLDVLWQSEELRSPVSLLWALSVLAVSDRQVLHEATRAAARSWRGGGSRPRDAAIFLYSSALLGAEGPAQGRAMEVVRESELDLDLLVIAASGTAAAACGISESGVRFFRSVARQAWRHAQELLITDHSSTSRDGRGSWCFDAAGLKLLGIIFACQQAECLETWFYSTLRRLFSTAAGRLDSELPLAAPADVTEGAASPSAQLVADGQDHAVFYKPPGWEVYGGHNQLQLVDAAQRLFGRRRLFEDVGHHHGFLHRLDVPSSGLVVLAKSYVAFYELQVDLHAGRVVREYQVLCHGWLTKSQISARLFWYGPSPSLASARGRGARTLVLQTRHLQHPRLNSLSYAELRLGTGRKHQIRSHLAHVGHPVVSDMVYQSMETYQQDIAEHANNCLHRHRLFVSGRCVSCAGPKALEDLLAAREIRWEPKERGVSRWPTA
ncbi:Pentatricopeptide repeat-containing protein At5g02860 [Durusdinium trenchii]|uniref:Pentatricopeptide repeat-containing protein At5g02860 n=1 Tax=Durusdinium trenchii TaxID=1381693 RepID=A0ABP0RE26_9DINO